MTPSVFPMLFHSLRQRFKIRNKGGILSRNIYGTFGTQESVLSTALRQSQQNQLVNESELVVTRLSRVRGLGKSTVKKYLDYVGLNASIRVQDLTKDEEIRLYENFNEWLIACNLIIGNNHREEKNSQLQKLRSIQSYRGLRNVKGLPVRGQKTKSNGRTKRKLRMS